MAGILDFVLNFPGHHKCKFLDAMRNILKIIASAAWAVILPFFYISTASKVILPIKDLDKWCQYVKGVPPLYILAVAVYLIPNILSAALFLLPCFRRWIENSDWRIVRLLLWWSQVFTADFFFNFLFCSVKCSFRNFYYEKIVSLPNLLFGTSRMEHNFEGLDLNTESHMFFPVYSSSGIPQVDESVNFHL